MILSVPTSGSGAAWVRLAANAINALIKAVTALDARDAALEGRTDALETFQGTATTALASLGTRATNLEAFQANPSGTFTFTPMALPGTPTDGLTVLDIADGKVKTWASGIWNAHY